MAIEQAACQICGDEYNMDSLVPCETCSWIMCEACEGMQGNCMECSRELGLTGDEDTEDPDVT